MAEDDKEANDGNSICDSTLPLGGRASRRTFAADWSTGAGGEGGGVYGAAGRCTKLLPNPCTAADGDLWGKTSSSGGVGGATAVRVVNVGQRTTSSRSSAILILLLGSHSKMRLRIALSSPDSGRIEPRNSGFFKYARNVGSSMEAFFQGFRPQVRFTRMMPRLHTSFGAEA